MSGIVHSKIDNSVIHLTLNHPARRNALSISLLRDLASAIRAAGENGIRAAVVSGAGGVFSAGADLTDLSGTSADSAYDREMEDAGAAIRAFPGPVIAAIDGPCMGAAVDLALSCDLRICSADAFFEVPATRLGLLYNPRAIARLHAQVSPQTLVRVFLLGERLDAAAALQAGLVARVVDEDVTAMAGQLARNAIGGSPRAVALTKQLLVALDRGDVDMTAWEALQLEILDSPERAAALVDARARREPDAAGAGQQTGPLKTRGLK